MQDEPRHPPVQKQSTTLTNPTAVNKRKGKSYAKRVADINHIYDTYVKTGLPNREIWKRYVYPKYGISEPGIEDSSELSAEGFLFPELFIEDETRDPSYFRKNP